MSSTATANLPPTNTAPQKMRISVDEYHQIEQTGFFEGKPRVELINGEIYTMSPIIPDHNGHVDKTSTFFNVHLFKKANIRTQGAIRIGEFSEPEPDIAILRFDEKYYNEAHPSPKDVYVVIEVAVFSVKHDRTIKKKQYAQSNIPEYWIIIPKKKMIEVYRQPNGKDYTKKTVYKAANIWKLEAFDLDVKGSDFLI